MTPPVFGWAQTLNHGRLLSPWELLQVRDLSKDAASLAFVPVASPIAGAPGPEVHSLTEGKRETEREKK